jgi:hypothetical protein
MALGSIVSLVVALCVCRVQAVHADVSELFEVVVRLRADRSLPPRRIPHRVKTETEAIWGPYGVHFEWIGDAGGPQSPASAVSLEVNLEREFEDRRRMDWPPVLGHVAVTPDASDSRAIHVSIHATESLLAGRTTGPRATAGIVRDSELARALGRVLAHEIGHVLLGPPYHDTTGLMRASFRPDDLGAPDPAPFRLTCTGVNRLRNRLRALRSRAEGAPRHDPAIPPLEAARTTSSHSSAAASCGPGAD